MANVVADKLEQAIRIKDQIRTAANAKNAGIPEGAPFADYPGYLEGLPAPAETTVHLDFSGGAMEITPESGKLFSKVNIPIPDGLAPENIPEGMTIAGIVGALAGGALAGGAKVATGKITAAITSAPTIEHNLGVVPDLIIYKGGSLYTKGHIAFAVGVSAAFGEVIGSTFQWTCTVNNNSTNYVGGGGYTIAIDQYSGTAGIINSANENTFSIACNSSYKLLANTTWYAIGGLT